MATQTQLLTNYSVNDLAGQSMGNDVQWAEIDHTISHQLSSQIVDKVISKGSLPIILGSGFPYPFHLLRLQADG